MGFTKLKLTAFGQVIEGKRHQGKGIHFTRVAVGDGLLGNGSMINRTELVSERHSMPIDGVLAVDDAKQSAVLATLDNADFSEGFAFREMALFARDPDTGQEGVYLYDNAGQECEFLNTAENGAPIHERLKLLIRTEASENITFAASGNALYITDEEVRELLRAKADLVNGKVPAEQLPAMDYIPTAQKGAANGVASLGSDGKVPAAQIPALSYQAPLSAAAVKTTLADADGVVLTDSAAKNAAKRITWANVKTLLGKLFVPLTRTVNGHALSADLTLTNADVGAAAAAHTHAAADVASGTLAVARLPTVPVNKGGTGKTAWTANRLAYPSAAAAFSQLAFPTVAGSVLRQGTSGAPYWSSPTELVAALGLTGAVRIQTGSYTGTGTAGMSNPCSLTLSAAPRFVWIYRIGDEPMLTSFVLNDGSNSGYIYAVDMGISVPEFKVRYGFGFHSPNGGVSVYGKNSNNRKTITWYCAAGKPTPRYQLNEEGSVYHWIAIF